MNRKPLAVSLVAVLFLALAGGCQRQHASVTKFTKVSKTLQAGGKLAEDSFYACLLNGLAQGLPLSQVSDECATKLIADSDKGFGDARAPLGSGTPGTPFDPGSISATCTTGDPTRSQARETYSKEAVGYRGSDVSPGSNVWGWEAYGYGTYGGKGTRDPADGVPYQGLSKEKSETEKAKAIKAADTALGEYLKAKEAARKETDPEKKKELEKTVGEKKKEWDKKHEDARQDPNKKPPDPSRTTEQPSACEQALEGARELLRECHRTNWRAASCQILRAKMSGCPDPTKIYVDPDSGYSCSTQVDPEAVKDAWVARCEELVKYGPGGNNPCTRPEMDPGGRYVFGKSGDVCQPNPKAMIDPDNTSCITVVDGKYFGQPDIQQIIILALDRIGGPIVVLPSNPKPPKAGPDPRPGPR